MKYLKQFVIILLISFIGEILHFMIPLPVPASIYGIIIMFFSLQFHIIQLDQVKHTAKFLIEIMPVMFIPAAVGLMEVWNVIKPSCLQYLIIVLVSTVVVMVSAGWITQLVLHFEKGGRKHE